MNTLHVSGATAFIIQFLVALYALRLNRRYGTAQVGWSLFGAFSLLAALQAIQSLTATERSFDAVFKMNVSYTLVSFLLLVGMVHLETMLKERLRREQLEAKFRTELESQVKFKTAHLNRAIDELLLEMEKTRTMSASIEFVETAVFWQSIAKSNPSLPSNGSVLEELDIFENSPSQDHRSGLRVPRVTSTPGQLSLFEFQCA